MKVYYSILSVLSGIISIFAFSPFKYFIFGELSLSLLLFVWIHGSPKLALWYGWLFGLGYFGYGVHWIYSSIHYYGHGSIFISTTIMIILINVMSLYIAIPGYILQKFFPKNNLYKFILAFPSIFVIFEWVRGWMLGGFPWLFLGYSHIGTALDGYAPILGVYGISLIILMISGSIYYCFFMKNKNIILLTLTIFLILWIGGRFLEHIEWTHSISLPVKISLIQGNINQEKKWNIHNMPNILNTYITLTKKSNGKIIVWPEAAIPIYYPLALINLKSITFWAKQHNCTILSGVIFRDAQSNHYYNGITVFGRVTGQYYKRQLVPFGEYLPSQYISRFLQQFISIPMSNITSGSRQQPDLIIDKFLFAPSICYEIAYSNLILDYLPRAHILLTICDDSWFGDSIALDQHIEIAQMRSLEVGRYQLFASNTGITALINSKGKIFVKIPKFKTSILTGEVINMIGNTPWVKYGQYLWHAICLLAILIAKMQQK